jgi:indolepyruvate ferredoxin oxidoreductase
MSPKPSLDDKYTLDRGRVFISGTQALVRLPLVQLERDRAAGIDTACYITGYRGSPLAGLDQQLSAAKKFYATKPIVFQPAVNEDLAATAAWGSQQAGLHGPAKHAGVFAMWYGKGPGVDRSGDALRHGNLAGSAALGGVLLLAGDDHTCESSTTCHQSEFAFVDAMIPVLNPAGVQELVDFGIYGWALSRYSGCWVALKCVKDTVEATASVEIDPARVDIRVPPDHERPAKGLGIRWPDSPAGAGDAPAHAQACCGARFLPQQRNRPRGDRFAGGPAWNRNDGKVVSGRSPGTRHAGAR